MSEGGQAKVNPVDDKRILIIDKMPDITYADIVKMVIDYDTLTVTLMLFVKHTVPKFDKMLKMNNTQLELIGQVKLPLRTMQKASEFFLDRIKGTKIESFINAENKGPKSPQLDRETIIEFGPREEGRDD